MKTKHPAVYADLEDLPIGWVGEILDDTLYAHPRATIGHARVESSLAAHLIDAFDFGRTGPGGWWILMQPELHFGRDVFVPDLVAWRKEKLTRPPEPHEPWMTVVPDWVCEILSTSTGRLDRSKKLPKYHRLGVQHAWLIEPVARTLEVLERSERGWLYLQTFGGDDHVRAPPFDAISLELGLL
jgi:Uma2 family endonuclease